MPEHLTVLIRAPGQWPADKRLHCHKPGWIRQCESPMERQSGPTAKAQVTGFSYGEIMTIRGIMHERDTVANLQNAHADHIESDYRQLMSLAGNPHGIEILRIGRTRVFLSIRNRLENRAIFTGNETQEELREITACFDRKGVNGFFEINPSNFYRTDPFSWKSELLPALLNLGYHPGAFRCVWHLDEPVFG